jgi:hypothetical protein
MGLFKAFALFPRLFGLAVPDLGAWLEVQSSHMRTYTVSSIITSTYTVIRIITSTKRQK